MESKATIFCRRLLFIRRSFGVLQCEQAQLNDVLENENDMLRSLRRLSESTFRSSI